MDRYYSPILPIPGKQVKSVSYFVDKKLQWSLKSLDLKTLEVEFEGQKVTSEKSQWIWFFRKLRDVKLSQHKFGSESGFKGPRELQVESEKGNIRFLFSENGEKSFIPELNVFADIAPGSLKSLSDEITKVMKSDKK